jgi:tRNA A58 N-methylase Trm61
VGNAREIDMERFVLIAQGHSAFQLLWAGVELGVFDTLSAQPGSTREQLEQRLGLAPYPCRVLLTGLTALGLVVNKDGRLTNAALADSLLVKDRPESIAPVLGWQAHIVYPGLQDFLASLRAGTNVALRRFPGSGNTLYERLVSHPELEQIFQRAMSALSTQANRRIVEAYDLGRYTHIVDAGGGDGTNAIALAKRYPALKVTVYDSESVCELARQRIAAAGMSERVFTWVGNFLDDPFPPGVDAILFCHIFTIWSMERNLELLRKCAQSLPAGGAVVLFNMMGDDDDSGPVSTALGSPYFLAIATGEGMLHSWKDYEQAMLAAGFSRVTRVGDLPLNHGLLIAHK